MTRLLKFFTAKLWLARNGTAAVEFALVAPVLLLLFTGAVSLGIGLRVRMEVGGAARSAAAYASSQPYDQAKIISAAQSATSLATKVSVTVTRLAASCISSTSGQITPASGSNPCPDTGAPPGVYVVVTTQMPYNFILPLPGVEQSTTLHGKAVARIQ